MSELRVIFLEGISHQKQNLFGQTVSKRPSGLLTTDEVHRGGHRGHNTVGLHQL